MAYVNRTRNHVGTTLPSETAFNSGAPMVAGFSSPGPNMITPGILKPDLSAPGIGILAAWSPLSSVSQDPSDKRSVAYNIDSGTSMACPHATGVAAYVKSFHPDWSPAMIMSSLLTTATRMDPSRNLAGGELTYGMGQLNPARAHDPSLVYDTHKGDYIRMLCAEGYNSTQLRLVAGSSNAMSCPGGRRGSVGDLNYPKMAVHAAPGKNFNVQFPRIATNVRVPGSVYVARIIGSRPGLLDVSVTPRRLAFSQLRQKMSFTVSVTSSLTEANKFMSAAVVWSDSERQVRSPVIVHTVNV